MTLHWWQHWFWITAAISAVLLVPTSPKSVFASSPWEEPVPLWVTTAWFQAAPSPGSWAVHRRLLGFAIPQAAFPVAGLPTVAPGNPAVQVDVAASTPTAGVTPTVGAVILTLTPPAADVHQPSSVQSASDTQNKSSQSVNTASPKTTPTKATRPKTLKTTVLAAPKSSMLASKLTAKTTSTTSTSTTTSTTPSPVIRPSTTILPPHSVDNATSPDAKGPGEQQAVEQLMNDSPADVPAASVLPATAVTSVVPENTSSVASPPASSSKVAATSTSTTTLAPIEEASVRAESTIDLGIVHPGVSFDNASGLHRYNNDSSSGLGAGSITGIALGVLLLAVLVGSVSFVLYRRRYLNKPQTLNDKCSNPDSSGYIDDSTLRENSEEMYSLDNDSFLNSLEAMTIQNYWTDSVKHTKL